MNSENFEAHEKFFWADQVAEDIIKERGKKKEYVCASGITPSGTVHFGNVREIITTDFVVRALKDKKKKVKFIYSWDDYDRLRKVPPNFSKSYEKYFGTPLSEIPSPFEKNKSYAQHFEEDAEKSLKEIGIEPIYIKQSEMNKKCKYAQLIKTAFEKNDEIKRILNKYRKEPLEEDWQPVEIYSKKTKKDDTKILKVNGYKITYADSTGFQETIDYRKKGIVKLKWRVDWPARWKYEKVDFEPGGIDHSVYGGSYTTSKEIAKDIFKINPPHYQFYDWVEIKGGGSMHSSRGNAIKISEVSEIYEPEIIRYFFALSRPNKGLQISFDNDVIKIYDEYDELERRYYNKEVDEKEKRIYEMCQINGVLKTKPEKIGFRHLITLVQIGKDEIKKESQERAKKVKNWVEKYAGEEMKFTILEKPKFKLDKKQKEALVALKESLSIKKINSEDELGNEIYSICDGVGIDNKEFFQAAYETLIGKTHGPRLSSLILAIGKEKIIKLLDQIK